MSVRESNPKRPLPRPEHEPRSDIRSHDLLRHQPQRLGDEHFAGAVHRYDIFRIDAGEFGDRALRLILRAGFHQVEAADDRMDFVDARHRLGAADGIDDAAMAARCDDDEAKALDRIASRSPPFSL